MTVATQPHGIRRSHARPTTGPLTDLPAVEARLREMQRQIDWMQDKLAERVNQMMLSGPLAQRPAAGVADRLFMATDTRSLAYDIGGEWVSSAVTLYRTTRTLAADESEIDLTVSQADAGYLPIVATTWDTTWRWTTKTAAQLHLVFSTPPPAGARVMVGLL